MINQCFAEGVKPNVTAKMEQPDSGLQKTDFLTPYTIIKALHAGNESPFFSDSTPFYKINLGCLYPEILAKENLNRDKKKFTAVSGIRTHAKRVGGV